MPREHHAMNDAHRAPKLRVVQHDKPEMLKLAPEIERELLLRDVARKALALVAGAMVLGITWALCEGILGIVQLIRK